MQFYVAQLAGCFSRDGSSEIPATEGRSSRPRGTLSLAVPSQAMAEANRDVQEATGKKKWGAYKRYSTSVRAEIGRRGSLTYQYLSNSCLPDFTINMIATNTHSSSVLVFVHDKFSR